MMWRDMEETNFDVKNLNSYQQRQEQYLALMIVIDLLTIIRHSDTLQQEQTVDQDYRYETETL